MSNNNLLKTELVEYLHEVELDEERVLANLVFDSNIIGQQLLENHFSVEDFRGTEANRVLLATILEILEDEESLTLPNLVARLLNQNQGKRTKLEVVGGEERVQNLFMAPFSKPGVKMLDDIEPLIEQIRDRNVRFDAHKTLVNFSEKIIDDEKEAFEVLSEGIQSLRSIFLSGTTGYLRGMETHVHEMEEMIAERRYRKQSYLGLNTNFPILMEKLNGFQKEFYLITGGVGMGKSTFATQLAWDLAMMNSDLTVIYFSLDMNRIDTTAKIISQSAELPIDYVKNPYSVREDFEIKRTAGLRTVSSMSRRFILVDESNGRFFIEDVKKLVKRTRLERGGEIAVVIDPLYKILLKNQHSLGFNESCNILASELKSLAVTEKCTVIATAGLPKAISNRRPVREDLEEITGLLYDPYAIFFLYCDYLNNFDTPFLEWEWGKEDSFMIPITEAYVAKNKMGNSNSSIFYRYFEAFSKFKECAPQEVENYSAMIDNLARFKEVQANQAVKKYDPESRSHRLEEF